MFLIQSNNDVILRITDYLSLRDVVHGLGASSRSLHVFSNSNVFWRIRLKRHFPHVHVASREKSDVDTNYKQLFKSAYENEYPPGMGHIFSAIKDGDVDLMAECKDKVGALEMWRFIVDTADKNYKTIFAWIVSGKSKVMKNFVFDCAYEVFKLKDGDECEYRSLKLMHEDISENELVKIAVYCDQSLMVFEKLKHEGINIDYKTKVYDTFTSPLLAAIEFKSNRAFDALIKLGIDVGNMSTLDDCDYNLTESHKVITDTIAHGNSYALQCFLEWGLKPNVRILGYPLIHFAVTHGNFSLIHLLCKAGADINSQSIGVNDRDVRLHETLENEGNTPLHIAATLGKPEVIKVLISYGADVKIINKRGMTPLEKVESIAIEFQNSQENTLDPLDLTQFTKSIELLKIENNRRDSLLQLSL